MFSSYKCPARSRDPVHARTTFVHTNYNQLPWTQQVFTWPNCTLKLWAQRTNHHKSWATVSYEHYGSSAALTNKRDDFPETYQWIVHSHLQLWDFLSSFEKQKKAETFHSRLNTKQNLQRNTGVLSDGTCHTPARQVPFLRWLHFSTHLPQDTPEYYTGKSAQARVQWDFAVEGNPWCKLRPISKLLRRKKQYGFKNIIPVSSKIDCQFFLKNNWDNDIVKLIFQNWTSFPVSVYSFTPHELTLVTSLQLTLVTSWNRHWWHHYNIITFTGRHPLIKHPPTRNQLLWTRSHTWATAPAWI